MILECDECGCASRGRAKGWAAFSGEDLERVEPTSIAILCPSCAAVEFEYRPEQAEDYT